MSTVKALTLWQPWATLIAIGAKKIETRSWSTSYRGPLAIHAAKRWKEDQSAICGLPPFKSRLEKWGYRKDNLPLGSVLAVVDLVEVYEIGEQVRGGELLRRIRGDDWLDELHFGDYTIGRYAWVLESVKRLAEPIPARGRLALWDFELAQLHY